MHTQTRIAQPDGEGFRIFFRHGAFYCRLCAHQGVKHSGKLSSALRA